MLKNKKHKAFLKFISKLADISSLYNPEELKQFLKIAECDFPAFKPTIKTLITLTKKTSSEVSYRLKSNTQNFNRFTVDNASKKHSHLFDLLRSKELFATNSELANFAKRVLPSISNKRFDKMSRGDIATRIIEYIEGHKKKDLLEKTMRDALVSMSDYPTDNQKKQTFFRKWEDIVKGSDF